MSESALGELRAQIVDRIAGALPPGSAVSPMVLADAVMAGWTVQRKRNLFRDAHGQVRDEDQLYRGGDPGPVEEHEPLVHYVVRTAPRARTPQEREADERRRAVWQWEGGDHEQAPPPGVGMLALLEQRYWWIRKGGERVRLEDMGPAHRRSLLGFLRDRALDLQHAESRRYLSAPDGIFEEFLSRDPVKWLHTQPLVKRLSKMVSLDNKRLGEESR